MKEQSLREDPVRTSGKPCLPPPFPTLMTNEADGEVVLDWSSYSEQGS